MHGFEDAAFVAVIYAGHNSQSAYQTCRQIRDDVSIQILQEQRVEPFRTRDKLHAGVVDDALVTFNTGKEIGNLAADPEEQPVAHLHDVGLVDYGDFLAPGPAGVFERELSDSLRCLASDDFQALDHARDDLMFDAGVEAFGVFAHDNQVEAAPFGGDALQALDRTEVRVQVEVLAQRDVDALVTRANRGSQGSLQGKACSGDRIQKILRQRGPELLYGRITREDPFPFGAKSGRFENLHHRVRDFGADPVPGYQGYHAAERLLVTLVSGQGSPRELSQCERPPPGRPL